MLLCAGAASAQRIFYRRGTDSTSIPNFPIVPRVPIVLGVPIVPVVPVYGFPKNNTALRLEKPNNARILKDDCRLIKTRL